MSSLPLRSKFLSLIYAPLLFYIVALWGCLEFWIVPKVVEKLAEYRVDTVSESLDNYIQAYSGKPEEILQANKNAIAIAPISKFIRKLESYDNNKNQNDYAKVFILDSCGGIIAPQDSQLYFVDNNQECNQRLDNIKDREQDLIQEIDKNLKKSLQNIIKNINTPNSETLQTRNFISKVTPLNYPPQQKWLMIVAISRGSIRQEITPWITLAKILCILPAIIVGIIFWLLGVRPIIYSIKSLTEVTEEIDKKNYELSSLKDANDRGDELALSDIEQSMEQNLEQQQLEPPREPSIKQGWEQVKQETDIHKKVELVMQIIEKHELQQLINTKK